MKPITKTWLAANGLLGGCVSPQARRGRVVGADVGSPFSNFTFQDERGATQDLRENLGDFTVLVFSECGKDMHGAVSTSLVDLVHANQEPGYVETVGFDIHWSKDGRPPHNDCHVLEGGPRIFSICDARANVRDLYEVESDDEIIVIGPDRRIADRASGPDFEKVAAGLSGMFHDHAQRVRQTRSPEQ